MGRTTREDRDWSLDTLISEVAVRGCEKRCQGSRTLPTPNDEFLLILVSLNTDPKDGVLIVRLLGMANDHDLAGRHLPLPIEEYWLRDPAALALDAGSGFIPFGFPKPPKPAGRV
jgi:hypothetical protein